AGQLRGFERFALKRPAVLFRNHWVFDSTPRIRQSWAFAAEQGFQDKTAFLAASLSLPGMEQVRISREGAQPAGLTIGSQGERRGMTLLNASPAEILFTGGGLSWGLSALTAPGSRCFIDGRMFFIALLDGPGASMDKQRWYETTMLWDLSRIP